MRPLPTAASFLITENCNLACTYCFEKHNTAVITKEVIEKGIDMLIANAITSGEREVYTMIFGGEPLLYPDLVDHLLTYGRAKTLAAGVSFNNNIITNATLFDDKIELMLRRHIDYITVQMSVDGIKESHDMYRLDRNGNGSFDRIIENVPKFKHVFEGRDDKLSIHGVLNKATLPMLSESYFYFRHTLGLKNIWFMPIHTDAWDINDVTVYDVELGKITDYIIATDIRSGKIEEGVYYAPIDKCLKPDQRSDAPCGAGKTFITITASGELYPCHQFYFNDPGKETKIGTLDSGIYEPSRELFVVYSDNDLSCRKSDPDCDAYQCYKCIGDNYTHNGSIISQITGHRCGLSKVERKYQVKVKEAYIKMGLLNTHDTHTCRVNNDIRGCDVVSACDKVSIEELQANPEKYRVVPFEEKIETVMLGMLEHIEALTKSMATLSERLEKYEKER